MPNDDGLKAEADFMMTRTLEAADRMVAGLESLHAQFPSDELREALLSTRGWRDRLREWLQERSGG